MTSMTDDLPKPRWYRLTPDRLMVGMLALEGFLIASEHFQWFAFNRHKGWTSLIAVAAVGSALVLMLLWFILAVALRRRFQFGIRSLLVLTAAVAVPCYWIAVGMKRAAEQREAVAELRKVEAFVTYDWQYDPDFKGVPGAQPAEPDWLRRLLDDDYFAIVLTVVNWNPVHDFTDADLKCLDGFRDLKQLALSSSSVTDEGLTHLSNMANLRFLSLGGGTRITDAGLIYLNGSTKLETLSLTYTQLTDKGLEHLKVFTHLRWLKLEYSQVTDDGLEQLKGLRELEVVSVGSANLTDAGVKKLHQALPNCKIYWTIDRRDSWSKGS
jgi:hypothetical protein